MIWAQGGRDGPELNRSTLINQVSPFKPFSNAIARRGSLQFSKSTSPPLFGSPSERSDVMSLATRHPFPPLLLPHPLEHSLLKPRSLILLLPQSLPSLNVPCLRATSSNDSSIFLPHLQQHGLPPQPQHGEEAVVDVGVPDPIVRFFRSRSSSSEPDPPVESKLSLQPNRRTSWHLSPAIHSQPELLEPEPEADTPSRGETCTADDNDSSGTVVGEVMRIARELPENVTMGEALEGSEEGKKLSEGDCLEVLRLMEKEGMVRCALYFFEWMRMRVPSPLTGKACSVVFGMLGRAGMGKEIVVLFRNLPLDERRDLRDVKFYNSAISGLMSSGSCDDAWELYDAMETSNIHPDHVTCSIMITILRKGGRSAKEAWEFFERMNRKGVKWSLEVMGALIKSFCDEGLMQEALIIQAEMEKRGVTSNVIVYNTLLDAYSKANHIEECEGLLAEMKSKGIKPTEATFNILMDAYRRRMQPEIVKKLLEEMQNTGVQPNSTSYTCLISAYGRQKKMSDMAADAFLKMRKAGIEPNLYSYTALIHAYSVSGWHEKAYLSFENMLREGIKPSIETYTTLLDAFRRAGDTGMLMKIWKMMIAERIEGTRVTFNILLDGFAKQGRYVEARDVISEFEKIGLPPTVMTYNMLMNAYARGGQHSRLPQLLKEMAALNLQPDSVTYSTMIYAFVRVRDFRRAFYYHKVMVKSGQVPDKKSYEKLRAILDVKAAIKNKKDKLAIFGIVNSRWGSLKPKVKRKKDEFWKNRNRRLRPGIAAVDR